MDIRCPICGEPWEMDELHDLIPDECEDYHKAVSLFRNKGCEAFGCEHNSIPDDNAALLSSMLMDILGDDVDGLASELDDAEYLGLI
jgi:hypothetical protein